MATISVPITADGDDGFDDAGGTWKTHINNYGGSDGFNVQDTPGSLIVGGLRFLNVAIPNGATINTATLTMQSRSDLQGFASFQAFGDDVDDAPAFSDSSRPQSGFTNTTGGTVNSSPPDTDLPFVLEIAACVQDIVDRGGWATGQDMRFSVVPTDTYAGGSVYDLDGGHSDEAVLDVDFTASGGGGFQAAWAIGNSII